MKITPVTGGITAAPGFQAAGVHCGIKASNKTKPDLALIFSEVPAVVGGVFTQNKVQAAPVVFSRRVVTEGQAQALAVNSGNANACTGSQGEEDARSMARMVAKGLGIEENQVVVSSTGVIGHQMPMDRVQAGIEKALAALSLNGGHDAATAIMTTDLFCKEAAVQVQVGEKTITIGGMAKGSGMIHPNMATMLAFLTTDAVIQKDVLQQAIGRAADKSFNMISVDGDTSTNDMCVVLANGKAGNLLIKAGSPELDVFQAALDDVCILLAKMIAKDGEGASRLLEVEVKNARSSKDARLAARAVVSSSLVKSAMFGEDANWGRILCAVGYSGAGFNPDTVDIWLKSAAGEEIMANQGAGMKFNEEKAKKILGEKEISVIIDLHDGTESAMAWGCDLTYDYVKINADYRT